MFIDLYKAGVTLAVPLRLLSFSVHFSFFGVPGPYALILKMCCSHLLNKKHPVPLTPAFIWAHYSSHEVNVL